MSQRQKATRGVRGGQLALKRIVRELPQWVSDNAIPHVRGAPDRPVTQESIDRWYQTTKPRILLELNSLPCDHAGSIGGVNQAGHCTVLHWQEFNAMDASG